MGSDPASPQPWWLQVLWPDGSATRRVGLASPDDLVPLPPGDTPRLLVPPRRPAARLVLTHGSTDRPARRRLRRALGGAAAGLVGRVPMPCVRGDGPTWLLEDARRVAPTTAAVGVRLGSPRPNQKPIVLASDDEGVLLAVGKVGFSPSTRALVAVIDRRLRDHEADPDALVLPQRLALHQHGDIVVHWQSPLVLGRLHDVRDPDLLVRGMRAICALAPQHETPLGHSPYHDDLLQRARSTGDAGVLVATERVLARHAATPLLHGAWHGDLTRWNLASDGRRLHVWDWERTADGVPVGLDACHLPLRHAALVADPRAERSRSLAEVRALLDALGVPSDRHDAVADLHLVELLVRFAGEASTVRLHRALGHLLRDAT